MVHKKHLFFRYFFALLLMSSIILSAFKATPVSAGEVDNHIKAWLYFKASMRCFHGQTSIQKSAVDNYNSIDVNKNGNKQVIVGNYIPGNGKKQCDAMIQEALPLWGYGSLKDLLLDAGYVEESNYYVNKDGKSGGAIWDALRAKGLTDEPDGGYLSYTELYSLWYWTFVQGCSVTEENPYDSAPEYETSSTDVRYTTYDKVKDGAAVKHIAHIGAREGYWSVGAYFYVTDYGDSNYKRMLCQTTTTSFDTTKKITEYANKAVEEATSKATDELAQSYLAALCAGQYPNDTTKRDECIQKREHYDEITACIEESKNAGTDEQKKDAFADCYAKKVGKTKEEILNMINGVKPPKGGELEEVEEPSKSEESEEEKQTKDCKIEEGVGWIVCPVINFLASINDFAYKFISSTFLETDKDIVQSDDLKAAWSAFRDIANVAFVIAFLIIVYSQITQAGISNYGIKRMLPRLFIAALLVNVSFIFCQLAVDLSNMLGYSLAGFFDGFAVGTGEDNVSVVKQAGSTLITWVTVAGVVLAAAAGIALAFLGPALMSSLLALLMIVLILVARKALIVILIAISPVAFVAYLLPNTEQWFKKWQKTFLSLLMLFPTVAVVFGGSRLAAKIIANAADEKDWLLQITALAVASIPFFIVPSLLQKSMEAAGTLGGKLTGLSQAANQRAGKAVKERSALGRYKQAWDLNRKQKQAQIFAGQYQGGKRNFLANAASRGFNKFNQGKHGPFKGTRQTAGQQAAEQVKKLNIDKVEAAKAQIEQANLDSAALARLASGESVGGINGKDKYAQAAAASAALDRGDHEAAAAGWDSVAEADQSTRNVFADAMSASDSRPAWMTAGEIAEMRSAEDSKTKGEGPTVTKADGSKSGIHKYDEMAKEQIKQNVYSPQRMAAASRQELEYARKVTSNDPEAQQKLKDTAEKVVGDEKLSRGLGKNSEAIQGLANLTVTMPSSSTPPPPAAPPAASGGGSSASTPPSRGFTPRGSGGSGRGR